MRSIIVIPVTIVVFFLRDTLYPAAVASLVKTLY